MQLESRAGRHRQGDSCQVEEQAETVVEAISGGTQSPGRPDSLVLPGD